MPTTKTWPTGLLLLLCSAGLQVSAWAGPTTTPMIEPETSAPAAAMERVPSPPSSLDPGSTTAVDVPNPSSTIKMLLELQSTPEATASAAESGRRAGRTGATRPAAGQAPAANPFGNGENPFASSLESARPAAAPGSQPAGIDWHAGPTGSTFGGSTVGARSPETYMAQRPKGSSADDGAEQRWWMPSALIRWVRENRQTVLTGAAVALGIAWAATTFSQRRR